MIIFNFGKAGKRLQTATQDILNIFLLILKFFFKDS